MKSAAVVLRNSRNPVHSVDYASVLDALLAGGVFLDEVVFLPYDDAAALSAAYARLSEACDMLFFVCDGGLVPFVEEFLEGFGNQPDEGFSVGEKLTAVFAAGDREAVERGIKRIDAFRNNSYLRVVIRAVWVPPEILRRALERARAVADGKFELHANEEYGVLRVELIYDKDSPKMAADEAVRILAEEFKDYVYALEDVSIAQRLYETLKLHRYRIATAESFTGGGVGREIVRVPGASEVFYEGLNTYDNKSKTERLGVAEHTIVSHGAVSEEVAFEMASGLLAQGHCDVAIATTGIAGPASDWSKKPAGLCYLAVATHDRTRVFRFHLTGGREEVTQTAINLALFLAYKEIS